MTIVEAHALAVSVEARIAELRRYVEWYRTTLPWLRRILADNERRHRAELAALLRLQRRAARIAGPISDPYPPGASYHDVQARDDATCPVCGNGLSGHELGSHPASVLA